jgi:hypothetical protein
MVRLPLLLLLLAPALVACGGRSALLDAAPPSAPPPADGGPCATLVVTGPPLGGFFAVPSLVRTTEVGAQVSVVHEVEVPGGGVAIVARAFAPWGDWPAGLPPAVTACVACQADGIVIPVSPALPSAQPAFAMLADHLVPTDGGPPAGFTTVLHPAVPAGAASITLPAPTFGVALARGAAGHLLAFADAPGPATSLVGLTYAGAGAPDGQFLGDVGCLYEPVSIVPVPGGFLVSVLSSLATSAGPCDWQAGLRLTVLRVDEATRQITVTASLPDTQDLLFAALAGGAAGEGGWLVYQTTDSYFEWVGPDRAVRVSASGEIAGPIVELSAPGDDGGFRAAAVTMMGSRLVVAGPLSGVEPGTVSLLLRDDDGQVSRLSPDLGPGSDARRVTLLPSPDGRQLLVGQWLGVARLSCAAGGT